MRYFIAVWCTYILHELFGFGFWYCKVVEVFNGLFVDGFLDPNSYSDLTFHPFCTSVVMSGPYLCFCSMVNYGHLS